MFEMGFADVAVGAASPSGSRPISSGRLRNNRLIGASTTSTMMPIAVQAVRHPVCSIISCTQGSKVTEPMPTPAKAIPIASPRRRMNQFGKNSDCPE